MEQSPVIVSPDYIINPNPSEFRFLLMLLRFSAMHLLHMLLKGTDTKLSASL